ncbi:unnamed protein product [Lampetra fluviatilis]
MRAESRRAAASSNVSGTTAAGEGLCLVSAASRQPAATVRVVGAPPGTGQAWDPRERRRRGVRLAGICLRGSGRREGDLDRAVPGRRAGPGRTGGHTFHEAYDARCWLKKEFVT